MKKLINFRPILYFAVSMCMGILSSYSFLVGKIPLAVFSIVTYTVCTLCLWFFWRGKNSSLIEKPKNFIKNKLIFTALALFLAVIGGLNMAMTVKNYDDADVGSSNYLITANVIESRPTENGVALVLTDVNISGKITKKLSYNATLYVIGESKLDIGDKITFNACLTDRSSVYESKFSAHYVAERIKYTSTVAANEIELISSNKSALQTVNAFIRDALKNGLDDDEFSVAYALMCGNSEYMQDQVISNFRASGVAHIFAVSGLHIGFFAVVLNFIATKLKFNKYAKFLFVLSVLIFYSGVCGFSASSIRATVMTAVLLIAEMLGKKYDGLSSISVAAIIILLYAPIQLFCVGFQLSFGVVLGITLLSRQISKIFKFLPRKVSSSLGVVLSAQIVGIPISLATFGEFSTIAIIANFIFVPFVGAIYILTLVTALIGGIFGIPTVALFVPNYIFKFIIMLITAFDYGIFMVGGISFFAFNGLYYLAFLVWSDKLNLKLLTRSIVCAISAFAFTLGVTLSTLSDRRAVKLIAVGGEFTSVAVVSTMNDVTVIINGADKYVINNQLSRALNALNADGIDNLVITNFAPSADVHQAVSVFIRRYDLERVYYYGEFNGVLQSVLEESFEGVDFYSVLDGIAVNNEKYKIELALEGYCVIVKTENTVAYLFSQFSDSFAQYNGLRENPDIIFAVNYVDAINARYSPSKIYCYRQSVYPNAIKAGNVQLKI